MWSRQLKSMVANWMQWQKEMMCNMHASTFDTQCIKRALFYDDDVLDYSSAVITITVLHRSSCDNITDSNLPFITGTAQNTTTTQHHSHFESHWSAINDTEKTSFHFRHLSTTFKIQNRDESLSKTQGVQLLISYTQYRVAWKREHSAKASLQPSAHLCYRTQE